MAVVALHTSFSCAEGATRRWQGRMHLFFPKKSLSVVSLARQPSNDRDVSAQEFFESFLKRRQAESDIVSRASDLLWRKEVEEIDDAMRLKVQEKILQIEKMREEEQDSGFLKLSQARSWSLGAEDAPTNSGSVEVEWEGRRNDRRRQSMLEYEALKRELSFMTIAVASACDVYCLLTLSPEAALSYGLGAVGSWFYLQLLFKHADRISDDDVAEVFKQPRSRKIGIRSSDVEGFFRKSIGGIGIAFQGSSRLSIPAALFAVSFAADRLFPDFLHLQTAPVILGFFAYKGAALLQAYRDNKDLLVILESNNSTPN